MQTNQDFFFISWIQKIATFFYDFELLKKVNGRGVRSESVIELEVSVEEANDDVIKSDDRKVNIYFMYIGLDGSLMVVEGATKCKLILGKIGLCWGKG